MADLQTASDLGLQRSTQPSTKLKTRLDPRHVVRFRSCRPQDGSWSEVIPAVVNPTTFNETTTAEYSMRPVLGLSHEVAQYTRTNSRRIEMELWISYHLLVMRGITPDQLHAKGPILCLRYRDFFNSLLVPSGSGLAPPLVAVKWPGARLNFKGVVTRVDIEYQRFNWQGIPIEYSIDLSFVEVADALMVSQRVRDHGLGYKAYEGQDPFEVSESKSSFANLPPAAGY